MAKRRRRGLSGADADRIVQSARQSMKGSCQVRAARLFDALTRYQIAPSSEKRIAVRALANAETAFNRRCGGATRKRDLGALPDWWPFGKKPAPRNPMTRTVYMMKTPSGKYVSVRSKPVSAMAGARRRRKRRRR